MSLLVKLKTYAATFLVKGSWQLFLVLSVFHRDPKKQLDPGVPIFAPRGVSVPVFLRNFIAN